MDSPRTGGTAGLPEGRRAPACGPTWSDPFSAPGSWGWNKDSLILAAQEDLLAQMADSVRAQQKAGIEYLIATAEAISDQVVRTPRYADAMVKLLFKGDPGDPICRILLGDDVGRLLTTLAPLLTPAARRRYRDRMNPVGALLTG